MYNLSNRKGIQQLQRNRLLFCRKFLQIIVLCLKITSATIFIGGQNLEKEN